MLFLKYSFWSWKLLSRYSQPHSFSPFLICSQPSPSYGRYNPLCLLQEGEICAQMLPAPVMTWIRKYYCHQLYQNRACFWWLYHLCTATQIIEQGKQRACLPQVCLAPQPQEGGEEGEEIVPWNFSTVSTGSNPVSFLFYLFIYFILTYDCISSIFCKCLI